MMKSGGGKAWYRRRAGFAVSVTLIALLVSLIFVGIHSLSQRPSENDVSGGFVVFSCSPSWNGEVFSLTVDVDLTDEMDRGEAIFVANALFENRFGQAMIHQFRSAEVDELGSWKVTLTWGYSTMDLGHWFEARIDPFNRTIVYNRCK